MKVLDEVCFVEIGVLGDVKTLSTFYLTPNHLKSRHNFAKCSLHLQAYKLDSVCVSGMIGFKGLKL